MVGEYGRAIFYHFHPRCHSDIIPSMSLSAHMAGLLAEQIATRGMTQRQFADLIGASTKHINLVLNGRTGARIDTLEQWARDLGMEFIVTLEEL